MPAALRHAAPAPVQSSRPRSRLIVLLVVGPLLCVLALTGLAYLGLSQQARRDAQAQVTVAAQAAHGALMANMGALKLTNGQLASSLPANVTTLNNNNAEAQRLSAQVGVDTLIVEREKGEMVVIASSLAPSQKGAAPGGLGERLSGPIATNACTTTTGSLTLAGADYLAASAPLVDGSGACVGSVVTLQAVSALRTTALQYTVILAMAGALLTLLTVAIGLALSGRGRSASEAAQAERIRAAVASLAAVDAACATQMAQREWVSRRLATDGRHLRHLMASLADDRAALQDATSDIWAGVSHPGAPIDPAMAMRLAREGAVVAARLGSRLNDVDTVADTLFADLAAASEVDAMLGDALSQTQVAIEEVRAATGIAEDGPDTGAQAGQGKRPAAQVDPYATNLLAAQRRRTGQTPAVSPGSAPGSAPRQTGGYRAVRRDSSQHRAVGDRGATGQTPAAGQSLYGRRPGGSGAGGFGASGAFRQSGAASSSGRHRMGNHPQGPRTPGVPRPTPRPTPRPNPNMPQDGRDRDSSGSRWLND